MFFLFELGLFLLFLFVAIPALGARIFTLFNEERTYIAKREMSPVEYLQCILLFHLFGFLFVLVLELIQAILPFNPEGFGGVPFLVALNTAVSFATNTNLQVYAGEKTLSYTTQMVGLTSQNFLSAATGFTTFLALLRGLKRQNFSTVGNFWEDVEKVVLRFLLPIAVVFALVLVSQGVIQTLAPYVHSTSLEGVHETIPVGPVASQEAIKMLGTNGGGFFNVNSCHPFENPTPLANFLETFAIILIPAATIYAFGRMVDDRRHGMMLLGVVLSLFLVGIAISFYGEWAMNEVKVLPSPILEGRETRIGGANSLFWQNATTATSCGATNAQISSLSPVSIGIYLFQMVIGEVIFGGIGVGICSIILFVILTVFLSGLMVGRTPEYLGKKIERQDIQWVIMAILLPPALIFLGTSIALSTPSAVESALNKGPHSFIEILYAFSSAAANNGSSLNGLQMDTPFYTISLALTMALGRLSIIVPSLMLAGTLAQKKTIPSSPGMVSTNTLVFAAILIGVIVIIGALTFCPAFFLGPIVEHFLYIQGRTF